MTVVVRPLTPERWNDLETIFNAKGCSVARGCWCMYYRVTGKGAYTRPSDSERSRSKEALKTLAALWSIVCFGVPSAFRGQGVARELLAGAVEYARTRSVRLLEAYPVDRSEPSAADAPWFGSKSMFDRAGFVEVARRKPARPVVRLKLVRG